MSEIDVKTKKTAAPWFERVEPMFGRGGRDWSVDVLRCLSCFLVCAVHSTFKTVDYDISGTHEWIHQEVYNMVFSSPTVLFVMVSGIFFLSPERNVTAPKIWKKNVVKMAFAYVFWSFIYAVYRIHMMSPQPKITGDLLFRELLVQQSHLWYIPMIIGLYMICPILRPITATYDVKLFRYIVVLFLGATVVYSIYNWPAFADDTSTVRIIIDKTPMTLICQYPLWMLIGWIAYTYRPKKTFRYIIYGLGIVAMIIGIYLNYRIFLETGEAKFPAMVKHFAFLQTIKNLALFYFVVTVFRNHDFSRVGKVFLRKWSDCTLIIYLVHEMFLLIMFDNDFLYGQGVSPWVGVWVYAVIAYVGGGIVAVLFHLFWDPIKKALFTKEKRSEKIYRRMERREEKRTKKG